MGGRVSSCSLDLAVWRLSTGTLYEIQTDIYMYILCYYVIIIIFIYILWYYFFPWSAQVKPETAHVDVLAPSIQMFPAGCVTLFIINL